MAVVPGAPRIDVALSRIGELIENPALVDDAIASLTCASLWREIYEGAAERGDTRIMEIAAKERAHALDVYRALTRDPG